MNNLFFLSVVSLTAGGLVPLLIWLLILALVIYVVFLVLGMLPLPEPAKGNNILDTTLKSAKVLA